MSMTNIPEDRHHPRKQVATQIKLGNLRRTYRPFGRLSTYWLKNFAEPTPFSWFLERHKQRSNLAPYFACFLTFYYFGTLLQYYHYRRNVIEDKWVQEYGQDVPHWRKNAFAHWV